ncbi:MAG TPA: FkbM family methyltransferase [Gemmatimonadales bacterium]|nr:FkbM family methyltransferase [Gemmatimonadales bacterium]
MKVKEFFHLLGLKPQPKTFGFVIEAHELPKEGRVEVARWLHPGAYRAAPPQAVVDQLRRFLRAGDVAIDIGAHTGDTAIPIALAVGPSGLVLALEPNPYVFPVLERNAALNPGKTSIMPLMFAAMRADGFYEFQYGEAGYCNGGFHEGMSKWQHGSAFKVRVEGKNLQNLLAQRHADLIPRLRFIKVDAEGFDLPILETLEGLIRGQRPYLQVEMFDLRKSAPAYRLKLYDFLVGHGYEVRRKESDENVLGDLITPENLLRWNVYDVFCLPKESGRHPTS